MQTFLPLARVNGMPILSPEGQRSSGRPQNMVSLRKKACCCFATGFNKIFTSPVLIKTKLTEEKNSDDNWNDNGGNVDIRLAGSLRTRVSARHITVHQGPAVVAVTEE